MAYADIASVATRGQRSAHVEQDVGQEVAGLGDLTREELAERWIKQHQLRRPRKACGVTFCFVLLPGISRRRSLAACRLTRAGCYEAPWQGQHSSWLLNGQTVLRQDPRRLRRYRGVASSLLPAHVWSVTGWGGATSSMCWRRGLRSRANCTSH